jgi:hypothetical protein
VARNRVSTSASEINKTATAHHSLYERFLSGINEMSSALVKSTHRK